MNGSVAITMAQDFKVLRDNMLFLVVQFALEWMDKLERFIAVFLLIFMVVKFMLM